MRPETGQFFINTALIRKDGGLRQNTRLICLACKELLNAIGELFAVLLRDTRRADGDRLSQRFYDRHARKQVCL